MSRILVVLRHSAEQIKKDVKYQGVFNGFANLGLDVDYTYIDGGSVCVRNYKSGESTPIGKCPSGNMIVKTESLYRAVKKYVKADLYDFCYIRLMPATASYLSMVKRMQTLKIKVVVEVPSYPFAGEASSDTRGWRSIVYSVSNHYLKKSAAYTDLFAVMGEKCDSLFDRPAINIENGIMLDKMPIKKTNPKNGEIHVMALAKMARWHGYDRLIDGLRIYKDKNGEDAPKVYIHMVGNDGDGSLAKWKAHSDELGLSEYVLFDGPRYAEELDEAIQGCDIAVAALAIHRKNAKVCSELKIKEYCARGIPFIYASDDNALTKDLFFCRQIPLDDSPVDIDTIVELYNSTIDVPDCSEKMRAYAKEKMNWEASLKLILAKLED